MTWENEIKKEYKDLTKLGLIKLVDLVEDAIKDLDKIEDILDDLDEGDEIELSKLAKNVVVVLNLLADNKKGIKELIDDRADRF
jgi:H2-forming N5,N10-methylenetetrahydromethanopterin dehydrogenase-like enzyme